MSVLRRVILAAAAGAAADYIWQKVRHDAAKGPAPPTNPGELAGAAVAGGALAGLWSWMPGRRR